MGSKVLSQEKVGVSLQREDHSNIKLPQQRGWYTRYTFLFLGRSERRGSGGHFEKKLDEKNTHHVDTPH